MAADRVIRVLLADDQRVVREGLGTLLSLLDGIELVATAADGEEAMALARRQDPDVVLMDLRMPRCDGIEAIRRLAERGPRPRGRRSSRSRSVRARCVGGEALEERVESSDGERDPARARTRRVRLDEERRLLVDLPEDLVP